MSVGFSNIGTANAGQNLQQKVPFGIKEKVSQKKQEFSSAMKDNERRYNIIGVCAGLVTLGVIGYALLHQNKVFNIFEKKKHALRKYLSPTTTTKDMFRKPHGGPDIDITKGPTAIHDAWTQYIKNLKNNRKNNANIFKYYKEVFAENADKLDELQKQAKEIVLKRGGIW